MYDFLEDLLHEVKDWPGFTGTAQTPTWLIFLMWMKIQQNWLQM